MKLTNTYWVCISRDNQSMMGLTQDFRHPYPTEDIFKAEKFSTKEFAEKFLNKSFTSVKEVTLIVEWK